MLSVPKSLTRHTRGFTLIELLVVVSTISLLSTVVLSSVQNVRTKTLQVTNSQAAVQYGNALQLYFEDQGQYPTNGLTVTQYCLGDYGDNACGFTNSTNEDGTINTQLGDYVNGAPTGKAISWDVIPGTVFEGPLYVCNAIVGGKCTWATVSQLVKGNSRQLCANACSVYHYGGDYWMCNYSFGNFNAGSCSRED